MSFLRAARAALVGQSGSPRILVAVVVVVLAGLSLSCGKSDLIPTAPNHSAYVTLPKYGSVLLLQIDGATGAITTGTETPQQQDFTPTGLALGPSKKFLYAINSFDDTISIFNVAGNGTLALGGSPTPAGSSPNAAVIDPSGKYLLVTNTIFDGTVSVFSIDSSSGALSEVGLPVPANAYPTEILFTHSGQFVYVTNPGIGMVTGFSFANGVLSPAPGSPVSSGTGAAALAVDGSDRFLYVANPSAINAPPYESTTGNISGFNIDPNTGALTPLLGSPFTSTAGSGPIAIAVDPTGSFVYAMTPGSSSSIWCFMITSTSGQDGELVAATDSPFSGAAGGLFALFDPSGNFLYIGNQSASGIEGYTYNPSTGAPKAISGSPFSTGGTAPGKMVLSE